MKAGLAYDRARGRTGGKKKGLSKEALKKNKAVKELYDKKEKTVAQIGNLFNLSRATVYLYIEMKGDK